jgi:hypothetical protein
MRLLPSLRRWARLLAMLALVAAIAPAVASASATAQAAPVQLVICTAEGLVTLDLGGDRPADPTHHAAAEPCLACLRADVALPPPPGLALPPPSSVALPAASPAAVHATPGAPPHARPDATGPPGRG